MFIKHLLDNRLYERCQRVGWDGHIKINHLQVAYNMMAKWRPNSNNSNGSLRGTKSGIGLLRQEHIITQPLFECLFHWETHYFINDWTCCQKVTFSLPSQLNSTWMVRLHHCREVILCSFLTPSELFGPVYPAGTLYISRCYSVPATFEFWSKSCSSVLSDLENRFREDFASFCLY